MDKILSEFPIFALNEDYIKAVTKVSINKVKQAFEMIAAYKASLTKRFSDAAFVDRFSEKAQDPHMI